MKKTLLVLFAMAIATYTAVAQPECGSDDGQMKFGENWDKASLPDMMQPDMKQPYMGVDKEKFDGKERDKKCFDKCYEKCYWFVQCDSCGEKHRCDSQCDKCSEPCGVYEYCGSCGHQHQTDMADGKCDQCGRECNWFKQCDKCGYQHDFKGACDKCGSRCHYDKCCYDFCDKYCYVYTDTKCKERCPTCDQLPKMDKCNTCKKGDHAEEKMISLPEMPRTKDDLIRMADP